MRHQSVLSVVCATMCAAQSAFAAPVDFRPRFTAGAESRVTMRVDQQYVMPGPMGELTSESKQMVVFRERVKSAESGKGAEVELTYERVVYVGETQGGRVNFDSQTYTGAQTPDPMSTTMDATPTFAKRLKSLVGTTLTLSFDAEGKITSVEGEGDKGVPMMMGPICNLRPEPGSLAVLFGPSAGMPAEKARGAEPGSSWDYAENVDISPVGKHVMKQRQTVSSADDTRAVMEFTGKFERAEDNTSTTQYVRMADSRVTGRVVWDVRAGRLLSGAMDVMTRMAATDTSGGGMTATNRSKITIERERR